MDKTPDVSQIREMASTLNEIASAYTKSAVLFAAVEADVFRALEEPRTAGEVAEAVGWNPRGVRMLLGGLHALDLVNNENGRYSNTPLASACLVPGGSAYQGNIIRHNRNGWDAWGRLSEAVRTGACIDRDERERSPEELRDFILGMRDGGAISAREMLEVLDLSRYRHMLDAGGGPATYSITFLKAYPEMKATLFDLPPVVEIARDEVRAAGLEDRFSFMPGDLTEDSLGSGHDLVLLSNLIHSFDAATNRALVKKAHDALQPGGTLVIKDFLVENDRSGPAFALLFALRMLLHTKGGDTYSRAQVASWTGDAGFETGRLVPLTPQTSMWIVDKPG